MSPGPELDFERPIEYPGYICASLPMIDLVNHKLNHSDVMAVPMGNFFII